MKELIEQGKTTSLRGLYYMLKHTIDGTKEETFEEQSESDSMIEDVEVLLEALEMMESNVEEPLSPAEIAAYLKVSRRQLERQFRDFLKTSPARKYLEIRLARARLSVLRTNRRIDDIAASCGFASTAHFIARYRVVYAQSPQAESMAMQSAEN